LKLQKRNLVEVETVAEAAVDAEMVVLSEVNSKETEIVHHAAVTVEIVEKVVLAVIEMVDVIVTVEEIVMVEEIERHVAMMVHSEVKETAVAEHQREMVVQKEMVAVVRKETVAVAQDLSVNLLIKIKNNKQYFYL
jgi:hypothetical protein